MKTKRINNKKSGKIGAYLKPSGPISLLFQCFAPRCLEIYPSLDRGQRQTLYCPHLQAAQDALSAGRYAVGKSVKLSFLKEIIKDENIYKNSSDSKINVSVLPDDIYVVPSFSAPTHDCPVDYVHIRKQKCPLTSCKESKSKLHTLSKKETPLCLHTILIHSLQAKSQSSQSTSSSASFPSAETLVKKTIKNPKINRDLTTAVVMSKISEHFPTMTEMESSGFIRKSRTYVEKMISSKRVQKTLLKCTRNVCTSCPESGLEDWPFRPKQAFLLSLGHLVKITIPVKLCRKCRRIFYPGVYHSKY